VGRELTPINPHSPLPQGEITFKKYIRSIEKTYRGVGGYGGSPREGGVFDRKSLSGLGDRKNLSIENPYRLKTGKNRLKKGWESKLGVVYLHWRGL